MPIFESDDEMTPEELKRQQKELNKKMERLRAKEFEKELEAIKNGDFDLGLDNPDDEDGMLI